MDHSGKVFPATQEWKDEHILYDKELMDDFGKNIEKYSDHDKHILMGVLGASSKFFVIRKKSKDGPGSAWEAALFDAYGDALWKGRKLMVTWHLNENNSPREFLDYKNPDDPSQGVHMVKNQFPENWSITATLDLPEWKSKMLMNNGHQTQPPEKQQPDPVRDPNGRGGTAASSNKQNSSEILLIHNATPWWSTLLVFPVTLIVWLVSHRKKKK